MTTIGEMKSLSKKDQRIALVKDGTERLREVLPEGSRVYSMVIRKTASGTRYVRMLAVIDGIITDISWWVVMATEMSRNKDGEIQVRGCGFDAGAHIVDAISFKIERKLSHSRI